MIRECLMVNHNGYEPIEQPLYNNDLDLLYTS
jgi:hypothetical protein